eukprot:gene7446-5244_t
MNPSSRWGVADDEESLVHQLLCTDDVDGLLAQVEEHYTKSIQRAVHLSSQLNVKNSGPDTAKGSPGAQGGGMAWQRSFPPASPYAAENDIPAAAATQSPSQGHSGLVTSQPTSDRDSSAPSPPPPPPPQQQQRQRQRHTSGAGAYHSSIMDETLAGVEATALPYPGSSTVRSGLHPEPASSVSSLRPPTAQRGGEGESKGRFVPLSSPRDDDDDDAVGASAQRVASSPVPLNPYHRTGDLHAAGGNDALGELSNRSFPELGTLSEDKRQRVQAAGPPSPLHEKRTSQRRPQLLVDTTSMGAAGPQQLAPTSPPTTRSAGWRNALVSPDAVEHVQPLEEDDGGVRHVAGLRGQRQESFRQANAADAASSGTRNHIIQSSTAEDGASMQRHFNSGQPQTVQQQQSKPYGRRSTAAPPPPIPVDNLSPSTFHPPHRPPLSAEPLGDGGAAHHLYSGAGSTPVSAPISAPTHTAGISFAHPRGVGDGSPSGAGGHGRTGMGFSSSSQRRTSQQRRPSFIIPSDSEEESKDGQFGRRGGVEPSRWQAPPISMDTHPKDLGMHGIPMMEADAEALNLSRKLGQLRRAFEPSPLHPLSAHQRGMWGAGSGTFDDDPGLPPTPVHGSGAGGGGGCSYRRSTHSAYSNYLSSRAYSAHGDSTVLEDAGWRGTPADSGERQRRDQRREGAIPPPPTSATTRSQHKASRSGGVAYDLDASNFMAGAPQTASSSHPPLRGASHSRSHSRQHHRHPHSHSVSSSQFHKSRGGELMAGSSDEDEDYDVVDPAAASRYPAPLADVTSPKGRHQRRPSAVGGGLPLSPGGRHRRQASASSTQHHRQQSLQSLRDRDRADRGRQRSNTRPGGGGGGGASPSPSGSPIKEGHAGGRSPTSSPRAEAAAGQHQRESTTTRSGRMTHHGASSSGGLGHLLSASQASNSFHHGGNSTNVSGASRAGGRARRSSYLGPAGGDEEWAGDASTATTEAAEFSSDEFGEEELEGEELSGGEGGHTDRNGAGGDMHRRTASDALRSRGTRGNSPNLYMSDTFESPRIIEREQHRRAPHNANPTVNYETHKSMVEHGSIGAPPAAGATAGGTQDSAASPVSDGAKTGEADSSHPNGMAVGTPAPPPTGAGDGQQKLNAYPALGDTARDLDVAVSSSSSQKNNHSSSVLRGGEEKKDEKDPLDGSRRKRSVTPEKQRYGGDHFYRQSQQRRRRGGGDSFGSSFDNDEEDGIFDEEDEEGELSVTTPHDQQHTYGPGHKQHRNRYGGGASGRGMYRSGGEWGLDEGDGDAIPAYAGINARFGPSFASSRGGGGPSGRYFVSLSDEDSYEYEYEEEEEEGVGRSAHPLRDGGRGGPRDYGKETTTAPYYRRRKDSQPDARRPPLNPPSVSSARKSDPGAAGQGILSSSATVKQALVDAGKKQLQLEQSHANSIPTTNAGRQGNSSSSVVGGASSVAPKRGLFSSRFSSGNPMAPRRSSAMLHTKRVPTPPQRNKNKTAAEAVSPTATATPPGPAMPAGAATTPPYFPQGTNTSAATGRVPSHRTTLAAHTPGSLNFGNGSGGGTANNANTAAGNRNMKDPKNSKTTAGRPATSGKDGARRRSDRRGGSPPARGGSTAASVAGEAGMIPLGITRPGMLYGSLLPTATAKTTLLISPSRQISRSASPQLQHNARPSGFQSQQGELHHLRDQEGHWIVPTETGRALLNDEDLYLPPPPRTAPVIPDPLQPPPLSPSEAQTLVWISGNYTSIPPKRVRRSASALPGRSGGGRPSMHSSSPSTPVPEGAVVATNIPRVLFSGFGSVAIPKRSASANPRMNGGVALASMASQVTHKPQTSSGVHRASGSPGAPTQATAFLQRIGSDSFNALQCAPNPVATAMAGSGSGRGGSVGDGGAGTTGAPSERAPSSLPFQPFGSPSHPSHSVLTTHQNNATVKSNFSGLPAQHSSVMSRGTVNNSVCVDPAAATAASGSGVGASSFSASPPASQLQRQLQQYRYPEEATGPAAPQNSVIRVPASSSTPVRGTGATDSHISTAQRFGISARRIKTKAMEKSNNNERAESILSTHCICTCICNCKLNGGHQTSEHKLEERSVVVKGRRQLSFFVCLFVSVCLFFVCRLPQRLSLFVKDGMTDSIHFYGYIYMCVYGTSVRHRRIWNGKLSPVRRLSLSLLTNTFNDVVIAFAFVMPLSLLSMSTLSSFFSAPGTPKPGAAAVPLATSSTSNMPASHELWVDKYKPQTLNQMCYPVFANKLKAWLENFYLAVAHPSLDPKRNRGVLLSGPPGIGKTTTVHVVAKEMGLTVVEYNASDFRSMKSLREGVSDLTTNKGFQHNRKGYGKMLLLMDEVDGCDRGGVTQVIDMLKSTLVPIICTCNDRFHPKLRSLLNHVEDMRFSRPPCHIVSNFLCDRVLAREGVSVPKPLLQSIIQQSGSDIRNMINNLQMWSLNRTSLSQEELAACAVQSTKNGDAGIFETAEYFLMQGTSRGERHTTEELYNAYYNGDLVDLFVQENYLHFNPTTTWMESVQMAADAISRSDAAQKIMYTEQNWSVSRTQILLSSILPCAYTRGRYESFLSGQQVFFDRQRPVKFPTWLGHNSTRGKNQRLLRCLTMQATHPMRGVSGAGEDVLLDYVPLGFEPRLTRPLVEEAEKEVGIERVMETMETYRLLRDDWDYIIDAATFSKADGGSPSRRRHRLLGAPGLVSCAGSIPTAVKSAFTRAVNKKLGNQPSYLKSALKHMGDTGVPIKSEDGNDDAEEEESGGQRHRGKGRNPEDDIPGLVVAKKRAPATPRASKRKTQPPASGAAKTAPARSRAKKAVPLTPSSGTPAAGTKRQRKKRVASSDDDSESEMETVYRSLGGLTYGPKVAKGMDVGSVHMEMCTFVFDFSFFSRRLRLVMLNTVKATAISLKDSISLALPGTVMPKRYNHKHFGHGLSVTSPLTTANDSTSNIRSMTPASTITSRRSSSRFPQSASDVQVSALSRGVAVAGAGAHKEKNAEVNLQPVRIRDIYGNEHVRVGKHRFPIFSHPFFRRQVASNVKVMKTVEQVMENNEQLQKMMDDMVEYLLWKGKEGVAVEEVEAMLQSHLPELDIFMPKAPRSEAASSPPPPSLTSPIRLPTPSTPHDPAGASSLGATLPPMSMPPRHPVPSGPGWRSSGGGSSHMCTSEDFPLGHPHSMLDSPQHGTPFVPVTAAPSGVHSLVLTDSSNQQSREEGFGILSSSVKRGSASASPHSFAVPLSETSSRAKDTPRQPSQATDAGDVGGNHTVEDGRERTSSHTSDDVSTKYSSECSGAASRIDSGVVSGVVSPGGTRAEGRGGAASGEKPFIDPPPPSGSTVMGQQSSPLQQPSVNPQGGDHTAGGGRHLPRGLVSITEPTGAPEGQPQQPQQQGGGAGSSHSSSSSKGKRMNRSGTTSDSSGGAQPRDGQRGSILRKDAHASFVSGMSESFTSTSPTKTGHHPGQGQQGGAEGFALQPATPDLRWEGEQRKESVAPGNRAKGYSSPLNLSTKALEQLAVYPATSSGTPEEEDPSTGPSNVTTRNIWATPMGRSHNSEMMDSKEVFSPSGIGAIDSMRQKGRRVQDLEPQPSTMQPPMDSVSSMPYTPGPFGGNYSSPSLLVQNAALMMSAGGEGEETMMDLTVHIAPSGTPEHHVTDQPNVMLAQNFSPSPQASPEVSAAQSDTPQELGAPARTASPDRPLSSISGSPRREDPSEGGAAGVPMDALPPPEDDLGPSSIQPRSRYASLGSFSNPVLLSPDVSAGEPAVQHNSNPPHLQEDSGSPHTTQHSKRSCYDMGTDDQSPVTVCSPPLAGASTAENIRTPTSNITDNDHRYGKSAVGADLEGSTLDPFNEQHRETPGAVAPAEEDQPFAVFKTQTPGATGAPGAGPFIRGNSTISTSTTASSQPSLPAQLFPQAVQETPRGMVDALPNVIGDDGAAAKGNGAGKGKSRSLRPIRTSSSSASSGASGAPSQHQKTGKGRAQKSSSADLHSPLTPHDCFETTQRRFGVAPSSNAHPVVILPPPAPPRYPQSGALGGMGAARCSGSLSPGCSGVLHGGAPSEGGGSAHQAARTFVPALRAHPPPAEPAKRLVFRPHDGPGRRRPPPSAAAASSMRRSPSSNLPLCCSNKRFTGHITKHSKIAEGLEPTGFSMRELCQVMGNPPSVSQSGQSWGATPSSGTCQHPTNSGMVEKSSFSTPTRFINAAQFALDPEIFSECRHSAEPNRDNTTRSYSHSQTLAPAAAAAIPPPPHLSHISTPTTQQHHHMNNSQSQSFCPAPLPEKFGYPLAYPDLHVWRQAVRTAVYSLLHRRLEISEADGTDVCSSYIPFSEMRNERGMQVIHALDADTLEEMHPQSYGCLDIGMDGNSSLIRVRAKPSREQAMLPIHISRRMLRRQAETEKGRRIPPSSALGAAALEAVKHPWTSKRVQDCFASFERDIGTTALPQHIDWNGARLLQAEGSIRPASPYEPASRTSVSSFYALHSAGKERSNAFGSWFARVPVYDKAKETVASQLPLRKQACRIQPLTTTTTKERLMNEDGQRCFHYALQLNCFPISSCAAFRIIIRFVGYPYLRVFISSHRSRKRAIFGAFVSD